jgi:DNA-binding XRE family transcriptional regulator
MERTLRDTKSARSVPPRQNGPAICALREKDGWTQTALAEAVGIRQASLSAIESESANARITTLNLIARKLHVPLDAIMRCPAAEVASAADGRVA